MIYSRPLKKVLDKIIPFNKDETINPSNLGSGTPDGTKFLRDDNQWVSVSMLQSLNDLTDVVISNPQTSQLLIYNGVNWINSSGQTVNAGPGVTYFLTETSAGFGTYEYMSKTPDSTPEVQDNVTLNNNTVLIHEYISDVSIGKTSIDAGIWEFNFFSKVDHLHATFFIEAYKRTAGGVETLLFSCESASISWTDIAIADAISVQGSFICNYTDKIVFKVYGRTPHSSDVVLTLIHSGNEHYSHIHTPLVITHNDIAGLQGGNSNEYYHLTNSEYSTYQSWVTSGIPDSKIQSASTWNAKQSAISLTTSGSSGASSFVGSVLNIPQYTLSGLGGISLSNLSASSPLNYNNTTGVFSINSATSLQGGYLTSTDWNTFNNKQPLLNGTGFIKISGTTISYDNTTYAPINSPTFTGTPLSTTPTVGDNSTKIATTAFVTTAVSNAVSNQITQSNQIFLLNNF